MKDILSKIVVTKTTLFLSVISVAAIIINHYASLELLATLNDLSQNQEQNPAEITNTVKSLQQYNLWVTMPLLLSPGFCHCIGLGRTTKCSNRNGCLWLQLFSSSQAFIILQALQSCCCT
ncbi:MAG: hypothetical protein FJ119_07785 [Deltaproteobacteria bacterium]|nr:hypothetical protein [Deltaproteobacteria bacterium]